jgi:ribosomal RNA-processing protein 8
MFAVPGWSLSTTDLKQQKQPVSKPENPPQTSTETANGDVAVASKSSSKKRKRNQNGGITKSNVDEMFRRHIDGQSKSATSNDSYVRSLVKGGKKKKEKKKNDKKNGKGPDSSASGHPVKEDDRPVDDGAHKQNKKQKLNKNDSEASNNASNEAPNGSSAVTQTLPPPPPATNAILTPLQQKMRDKLLSSRFRHLNETLYTTPSKQALELFTANPELFAEYHAGFSRQVKESWPSNPVDGYINAIQKRGTAAPVSRRPHKPDSGKKSLLALPRRPNGLCTIADLGCGDAQLARALTPSTKKLQLKLLSYDLHAPDPLITKADISALPLADGSVDIAIFCLSLMGTNWVSFVEEAWRVLRGDGKGECWVSEVKSRFGKVIRKKGQIGLKKPESKTQQKKNNNKKKGKAGGDSDVDDNEEDEIFAEDAVNTNRDDDETDISAFVEVFRTRGFALKAESVDKSNKMFVKMEFVKSGSPPTRGKYAGVESRPGKAAAPPPAKKRFIDHERNEDGKGLAPEEEAKVLKPCVYKTR